jgi:hypothetical protein
MSATATASAAVRAGQEADSIREAIALAPAPSRARNLAAGAVTMLVTLIIVLLAALVGGEFASAIPSDSTFGNAINTTTDNAGTAFVIFGVSLLAIPAVAVLSYIVLNLGGFMNVGNVVSRLRR